MMRLAAILTVLATQALAWPVPWDGFWRVDHQECAQSARYAGADTIRETRCHGLAAHELAVESAWQVTLRSDDGGRVWTATSPILLNEDRVWVGYGPGGLGSIAFYRCENSDDY